MLVASWVEERAGEPQKRLSISAMLGRLEESVEKWGKSVVPLAPDQYKENSRYRIYLSEFRGLLMILRQSQVPMVV